MRIGSFFTLLVGALVALGFLFSDWLHLQHDVAAFQQENQRLTAQLEQAIQIRDKTIQNLNDAKAEWQVCEQDVNQLRVEKKLLSNQVSQLEQQDQLLTMEIYALNQELNGLTSLQKFTDQKNVGLLSLLALPSGASIAVLLGLFHPRTKEQSTKSRVHTESNNFYVQLTIEERDLIIARRRRCR